MDAGETSSDRGGNAGQITVQVGAIGTMTVPAIAEGMVDCGGDVRIELHADRLGGPGLGIVADTCGHCEACETNAIIVHATATGSTTWWR